MDGAADIPVREPQKAQGQRLALYGLTPELERAVLAAIDHDRSNQLRGLLRPLHSADIADLLTRLDRNRRRIVVEALRKRFDPEILPYLDDAVREEVFEVMGTRDVAAAVSELDSDDAVDVIEDMDDDLKREILRSIPSEDRIVLEQGLQYPEASAGRLMQREFVTVPQHWTVGQTIDFMRTQTDLPEVFYDIVVVDPERAVSGVIDLSRLLKTKRPVRVADIMATDFHRIPATTDQEEVALLFRRYGLVSAPVVDDMGRLIGQITVDDVVDVIDEEAEEDILRLAGVEAPDITSGLLETARARLRWLLVNLLTALVAASVIGLFADTIAKVVALAALAPVVASLGGNAGTQTLAVTVRALAMREIGRANAIRVIRKEAAVGLLNGAVLAVVAGAVSWAWFGRPELGAIIGSALVINLLAAALAGMTIPLAMHWLRIDPAVSSGVFLTAVTDVTGFFAFLGLATWLYL
jgi:magnesium transporter